MRNPRRVPRPRKRREGEAQGAGGRAAELARTNESRKEEAKSFSVKRPKPTERRRRSLAEAKRSELCSPRRSAALRPRPSGRRPGSRCGDGTRCSPVRPSENGRTLMCVTEAAHAACARRAPCSGPAVQPRSSVCRARRPGSGRLHSPHCRCRFRGELRPPRSLAGRALRAARVRSVCRHCGSTSPPVCLSGRGSRD